MSGLDLEKIEGPPKQPFGLPAEVRVRIYEYLLLTPHTRFTSLSDSLIHNNIQPAILRTCKTIHHEASDVLNRKNPFIHIVHKSSSLERNLSIGGVSLLSKKAPCKAFRHFSLEMRIITTNLPLSNEEQHLMIASEDLPTVCKLLWVLPLILGADYFSLELKLSESVCGIALSMKTEESLLLPFEKLWKAASITVEGATNKDLTAKIEAAPRTWSLISAHEFSQLKKALSIQAEKDMQAGNYLDSAVSFIRILDAGRLFRNTRPLDRGQPWDSELPWCIYQIDYVDFSNRLALAFIEMGQWRLAYSETRNLLSQVWSVKFFWPDAPISVEEIATIKAREEALRARCDQAHNQMT